MKKQVVGMVMTTALCTCLIAGCGAAPTGYVAALSKAPAIEKVSYLSSNAPESNMVLSLKTEGYHTLPLKDFNAAVQARIEGDADFLNTYSDYMGTLTPEDSDYSFVYETLNYSIGEVISPQMNEPIAIMQSLIKETDSYQDELGETWHNFIFNAFSAVEYRVLEGGNITVQERDQLIAEYRTALQKAISNMSKEELQAQDIKQTLQSIADALAKRLSTTALIFENAEILRIEVLDNGQEYQG